MGIDDRASRLTDALLAAGVPIDAVRNEAGTFSVVFKPAATREHRDQAQAIVDNFDRRPRRPRSIAAIVSDLADLSAQDRNRLLSLLLAAWLRQNPRFAREAGVAIDGDEVDA